MLAAMLNAGVHPVVPGTASVGAADIMQMAGMAQVAIALGRAARVAEAADVAAALSMEATGANTSVLRPAVGRAKPIPGQVAAADHLRGLLAGSPLLEPGGARSVQDALSFRVVPQVHGALREYVSAARSAVTAELNAASDNPLVSVPDQALVSNGNFQPMVLAIAHDALRIALAQVGLLSERRMSHLWDAFFRQLASGLPPTVAYGLQLRYPAAALFPELRQLAAPASLDTPPLDLGVEDHGTGAPLSVRKADAALGLLEDLLAIELLLASDVLAAAPARPALGAGTAAALRAVEQAIAAADPRADAVHRALRDRFPPGSPRPAAR
jgi:histidine ammonia-lyase